MKMGWLWLLGLVFVLGCKEKKKSGSSDVLEGAWYLGSRSGCAPQGSKMSHRKIIVLTRVTSQSYDVEQTHFVYEDKNCQNPLIRHRAMGKVTVSTNTTRENRQILEVYIDRSSFHVTVLSDKGLTLVNLMDGALGLQGVPKERFCQKDADWILGEEWEVTGKTCGVDLDTTTIKQGLQSFHVLASTGKMFWTDLTTTSPYFPSIPREAAPSTWFRASI